MDDRQDDLLASRLRDAIDDAPFPADRIRARIRRTLGAPPRVSWRSAARVAAVMATTVLVFVAGMEYGRGAGNADGRVIATAAGPASSLPLTVQFAGSQYVASLAQLSARSATLTPDERRLAREVAATLLYAAAAELMRDAHDDPVLRSAARLLAAHRDDLRAASSDGERRERGP